MTLGLGLGLNAAVFSVVYGILLRPLDVPEPDSLVMVWQDMTAKGGQERAWTSRGVFSEWREHSQALAGMTAFIAFPADLSGGDLAEQVPGLVTSHEYFSVVGVEPMLGRGFLPEEEETGRHLVVVLSHGLWKRRFAGDPDILGKTITINGADQVIVGVMPEGFKAPLEPQVQLWAPLPLKPKPQDHGYSYLRVLGRLAPGVGLPAAQQELDHVAATLRRQHPVALQDVGATAQPLIDAVVGPSRKLLGALFFAVTLVLLAACINVASLTLARTTVRGSELAIRVALGANRRQLAGQLFGEALLLSLGGGVLGMALGAGCLALLRAVAPSQIPRLDAVHLDPIFLGYTLLASLLAALLVGVLPAFVVWRNPLADTLRVGGGGGGGSAGRRWRNLLVGAQVALGLVLLIGASLLGRTLYNLAQVDLGFRPEGLALGRVTLAPERYPQPADMIAFLVEVEAGLERRGEIESAGAVSSLPLADGVGENVFTLDGAGALAGEKRSAYLRATSPGFFKALQLRPVDGRLIEEIDVARSAPVAVVNQSFARRFLVGGLVVGRRLRIQEIDDPEGPGRTIVGVVADIHGRGVDQPPLEEVYVPLTQETSALVTLVARATGEPKAALAAIREEVASVRSDQVVAGLTTMKAVLGEAVAPRRFAALLTGLFAGVVLVLVGAGLYGVILLTVTDRRREIAIRLAMGAPRRSVVGLVLRWNTLIVVGGIVVGLAIAAVSQQGLTSLLYGVKSWDLATVIAMVLLLCAVALVASFLPVRRALRLNPAITLHGDAA